MSCDETEKPGRIERKAFFLIGTVLMISIFLLVFFTPYSLLMPILLLMLGLFVMGEIYENPFEGEGRPNKFYMAVFLVSVFLIVGGNLLRWKLGY